MSRIWQTGFELNSVTNGLEFIIDGAPTIVTTPVNNGTYALNVNTNTAQSGIGFIYSTTGDTGDLRIRFYFRTSNVSVASRARIFALFSNGAETVTVRLNTTGVLQLLNGGTQVGSDSAVLSNNTWYRVEVRIDRTNAAGSQILELLLNGTVVATSSAQTIGSTFQQILKFGNVGFSVTVDFYYDDIAVNSGSGSFQVGYPGIGKVTHYMPNAAGDANTFSRGGADSGNNWDQVNEVTPNDATDYNSSNTLNQEDLFNVTNTGSEIGSNDTINVVALGVRYNGAGASSNSSFKLEVEASSGGTIEQSAAITPSSVTWITNANTDPKTYPLVLYDLPGASTSPWTKSDLDNAQIGYKLTSTSTNAAQISAIWLSVDSTPASGVESTVFHRLALLGVG